MGFFEKLMCKLFPYTDIMRDDTNDIYLRRWFIYPRDKDFGKNKGKGRIYLHKFYRGDEDPHLHDHPWPFTSLILTRGYWEETYAFGDEEVLLSHKERGASVWRAEPGDDQWRRLIFYRPFSLLRRPATWKHRVILANKKPVWTLIRTGVKERSWGFWIKSKMCPWRQYNNGVCWCGDESQIPEA